jgi:DNA-binding NtrC family response regulator
MSSFTFQPSTTQITDEPKKLQDQARKGPIGIGGLQYRSRAMRRTMANVQRVAQTDSTVLLTGETGSGKDYWARYIHKNSRRSTLPFCTVDFGRMSEGLTGSELFGHEAGAFTGAIRRKRGLLELAHGVTLLLSEIGEFPLNLQPQLLDFFTERSFHRVGGENRVTVNVRIIAATNRDLKTEVDEGKFRPDLYYRLNVISITIPPLRERREDIPILVQEILADLAGEHQLPYTPVIDSTTMDRLCRYAWPGNVRELRNILEKALVLGPDDRVDLDALNLEGKEGDDQDALEPDEEGETPQARDLDPVKNGPSSQGGSATTRRMESIEEFSSPAGWTWLPKPDPKQMKRIYRECIVERGYTRADVATVCGRKPATGRKWFSGPDFPDGESGRRPSRNLLALRLLIEKILAESALL